MKVEISTVTELLITEVHGLDPISVYLEEKASSKAKITVRCFDETWHAQSDGKWDGLTVGQFLWQHRRARPLGKPGSLKIPHSSAI